jgi:hypothetical protein
MRHRKVFNNYSRIRQVCQGRLIPTFEVNWTSGYGVSVVSDHLPIVKVGIGAGEKLEKICALCNSASTNYSIMWQPDR